MISGVGQEGTEKIALNIGGGGRFACMPLVTAAITSAGHGCNNAAMQHATG